jgi:uncharacterized membrane protein YeaQ/YmgE (transglycosylase-associated protein family)
MRHIKKEGKTMGQMGWLAWLIVGAIAGWLASRVMRSQMGFVSDILAGMLGALIGGFLFNVVGASGGTGFTLWSVFVAFVGAVVLLGLLRLANGRQRTT